MVMRIVRMAACTFAAASLLILIAASGCLRTNPRKTLSLRDISSMKPEFVGNQSCARCHQKECRTYAGTRHAKTMYVTSHKSLGELAPPAGPIGGSGFFLTSNGANYWFGRAVPRKRSMPLHYALGSGKTGQTYVDRKSVV